MPHYMFKASYSTEGLRGVLQEGAGSRLKAVKKLAAAVGGKVEVAYWAFGAEDFILVAELPDNIAAAAIATRVTATGTSSVSTTVLLTADEIDKAAALEVPFRPPGG